MLNILTVFVLCTQQVLSFFLLNYFYFALTGCKIILHKTLFVLGEIGGDDFNYLFIVGRRSVEQVQRVIPIVITAIESAMEVRCNDKKNHLFTITFSFIQTSDVHWFFSPQTLIKHGAKTIIVPGNFPIGCNAIYLTVFHSTNQADYDQNGCLIKYNNFAKLQNSLLVRMLRKVGLRYPRTKIRYVDYYNSAIRLYSFRQQLGT